MRSLTPVSFVRDPAARRALITAALGTPWIRFTEAVLAEVQADPQIADWNIIIDDQGPMQDVDVDGMIRMGEAFCKLAARPEDRTFTVVMTQDPFFATWARVIDMNYSGRRRHGAPTLGEARRLMDRLEPSGGLCPQGKGPGNGRQQFVRRRSPDGRPQCLQHGGKKWRAAMDETENYFSNLTLAG